MSQFSGRCDLFDHIMMEKMYPSPDNPNALISDDMECFNIFKEKTGGTIYRQYKTELTELNLKTELAKNQNILSVTVNSNTVTIPDKRCKSGTRTITKNEYTYCGKTFKSLEELNKFGYWTTVEIKFNTILDLIPYFPYVIALSGCGSEKEYIVLATESELDTKLYNYVRLGYEPEMMQYYQEELQKYTIDIIKKYF